MKLKKFKFYKMGDKMRNNVLAIINGKEITEFDVENIISQYSEADQKSVNTDNGREKILDQLVSCELMYNFAQDEKLEETDEFKVRIEEARKDILTQMGISKAAGNESINENEALDYYNSNKEKFIVGEMVSVKHILVESQEEAYNVKNEIENNQISFSDAALKYSMCPSNMNGGSLGTFGRGKLTASFEEAAFNAKINILTDPVETEFGFHIILVEDFRDEYIKEFDDVKEEIMLHLKKKRELKNYKEIIEKMKKKYYKANLEAFM